MEASSWPMNAPTHTAATANHGALRALPDRPAGRRGSTSSRSHVHVHGRVPPRLVRPSRRRRPTAARPDVARRGTDQHLVATRGRSATRACPRPSTGRPQRRAPPRPSPAGRPPPRLSRTRPARGRAGSPRDSSARTYTCTTSVPRRAPWLTSRTVTRSAVTARRPRRRCRRRTGRARTRRAGATRAVS